jgi:hypothetical protein
MLLGKLYIFYALCFGALVGVAFIGVKRDRWEVIRDEIFAAVGRTG